MAADMIRWTHTLFLPAAQVCNEARWHPSADVYRTRDGWLVKYDLAGVRPEDIELRAAGRQLTVCGTRRDCSVSEGCTYYRLEIAYNHFERTVELPCDLAVAEITSEYRDGMLMVHIKTPR